MLVTGLGRGWGQVGIFALRDLGGGEEITFDYRMTDGSIGKVASLPSDAVVTSLPGDTGGGARPSLVIQEEGHVPPW